MSARRFTIRATVAPARVPVAHARNAERADPFERTLTEPERDMLRLCPGYSLSDRKRLVKAFREIQRSRITSRPE